MAGMLPGVEAARRRGFHHKNSTRRSSFCLYAITNHDYSHLTSNSSMRNSIGQVALCDESKLCAEAREAKKRLDERLQPKWRSELTKRTSQNGEGRLRSTTEGEERPKSKKSGSKKKRLNWLKLRWKSSEQEECAVCLEQLKRENQISEMQLPCGHSFHTNCLSPWLEANARCPCCRMEIHS